MYHSTAKEISNRSIRTIVAARTTESKSPLVSIVVPTKKSSENLPRLLNSIADQQFEDYEVIVVDDGSERDRPASLGDSRIRFISRAGSRTFARNIGIRSSRGMFIMSLDSDMSIERGLIEECVTLCIEANFDAVIVPETNIGEGYWGKCLELEKLIVEREPGYEASRFFRQNLLKSIGGYDECLVSGEDYDLQRRIDKAGFRTTRSKHRIKHHIGEPSFGQIVQKSRFYADSIQAYRSKINYKSGDALRLLFKKRRVLIMHPIRTPGFLLLKLIEYLVQHA